MRLVTHSNKITEMRWRASQQMPKGTLQKFPRHVHNPSQGRSTCTDEYVGVNLVRWLIKEGKMDDAQKVLDDIKAGRRLP